MKEDPVPYVSNIENAKQETVARPHELGGPAPRGMSRINESKHLASGGYNSDEQKSSVVLICKAEFLSQEIRNGFFFFL